MIDQQMVCSTTGAFQAIVPHTPIPMDREGIHPKRVRSLPPGWAAPAVRALYCGGSGGPAPSHRSRCRPAGGPGGTNAATGATRRLPLRRKTSTGSVPARPADRAARFDQAGQRNGPASDAATDLKRGLPPGAVRGAPHVDEHQVGARLEQDHHADGDSATGSTASPSAATEGCKAQNDRTRRRACWRIARPGHRPVAATPPPPTDACSAYSACSAAAPRHALCLRLRSDAAAGANTATNANSAAARRAA